MMLSLPKLADVLWKRERIALVRDDSPMARPFNHVPYEVDTMYETVAKDKDFVFVHVLVLSFEEPRTSGGVNSAFISFSFIRKKFKLCNILIV